MLRAEAAERLTHAADHPSGYPRAETRPQKFAQVRYQRRIGDINLTINQGGGTVSPFHEQIDHRTRAAAVKLEDMISDLSESATPAARAIGPRVRRVTPPGVGSRSGLATRIDPLLPLPFDGGITRCTRPPPHCLKPVRPPMIRDDRPWPFDPVSVFDEITSDPERRLVESLIGEAEMEPGKCPHHLASEER